MVAFLCNGEKWDYIGPLRALALNYGFHYYITDSIGDVGRVIAEMSEDKIEDKIKVVCILGGDGTICQFLTSFLNSMSERQKRKVKTIPLPIVAVLGGGTMNDLFKVLNPRGSPDKIAARVIEDVNSSALHTTKIPLLKVEHNGKSYFGFMFVLGPIARLLKKYTDEKRNAISAFFTAVGSSSASLFGWPESFEGLIYPARVSVVINGRTRLTQQNVSAIIASTIKRTVFGFYPFLGEDFEVSPEFKRFYFLSTDLRPKEVVGVLPYFAYLNFWERLGFVNPSVLTPHIFNRPIESLSIMTDEGYFVIDGEIFEIEKGGAIKISQGPEVSLFNPL